MTHTRRFALPSPDTLRRLALAAITFALAACGGPTTARTIPAGVEAGDLTLAPCTVRTDSGPVVSACGTLIVGENTNQAGPRLIALPIIRIRATSGDSAEPVFWLEGGPGMSNMKFKPPAALLRHRDFVMVGYRGVDGSTTLDCPEYAGALRIRAPLSARSLVKLREALMQCMTRLQTMGFDLARYTMREVVADMEAARARLGYSRVNLLSESYGTRVAQIYADLHPDRIHRSVMIGVNPPGGFVWQPRTVDAQIQYYSRLCARDAACSARTSGLAETIRAVNRAMPRRWLLFPIDQDKVKVAAFVLLFNRKSAAMVFDAYTAAAHGDPSGLALLSVASDFVVPGAFTWGEMYAKAASADLDTARNYQVDMSPPDAILGSPLSLLQWGSVDVRRWPIPLLPEELRRVQRSEVQSLLVSGTVDFSTPAQLATEDLLPSLPHGRQVVLAEFGHTADLWKVNPRATERLVTSFFDTGVADSSLYHYAAMDFRASPRLPTLAKLLLGLGSALTLGAVAAILFLIRWVHRRRIRSQLRAA
jgi:pimeloyl-ACP methyl ester carboxylesterase